MCDFREPWSKDFSEDGNAATIFDNRQEDFLYGVKSDCKLDRAIACVNALSGLSNVGTLGSVARLVDAVKEVFAVCNDLPSGLMDEGERKCFEDLQAALAEFDNKNEGTNDND